MFRTPSTSADFFCRCFLLTDVVFSTYLFFNPFKACCPMIPLLQYHSSFRYSVDTSLTRKKAQHSLTPIYILLMRALWLTHSYRPWFRFQHHHSYHHINNCNCTLTCSFSCLMDCCSVRIWLNKGLLSVLLRTVRFSLCWESLFSRSLACRRSRICSTCCLSTPQSKAC